MATPRDFLEDDYNPRKQTYQPRDFLETEEPEETLGQAAKYAPFRVGEDLINAGKRAAENSPQYWEKAKTEVPGFLNTLNAMRHPIDRGKQVLAGLLELGQGINHAPRNVAQYAANRLHLIPQSWADKIPAAPSLDEDIEHYLGSPQRPGDALARGLARNADVIAPGIGIANKLNPLNLTAKNIAKDIVKTREKNIGNYGNRYENLWKEAESKGFGDALYDIDVNMKTLKKYSPDKALKGLEDFDKNPTLQNAHNAKSDLLRIKRDLDKLTTLRTAERQQLAAANNAIDSINKNMFKDPEGKIHEGMKQKYNELQEGYRNEVVPYKNKAINEFIRGESSADELVNSLSRKAFYAKRGKYHNAMRLRKLVKSHPYLAGIGTGSALGAGGLGLYEELFGKKK